MDTPWRAKRTVHPSSLARASLAPPCVALKEQCLAQYRRHRGRLEWFGNEERRLWPLASQETLRIGGNEYDRHFEGAQHLIHRIKARTAVSELNVSEDYSRPLCFREGHGFRMRPDLVATDNASNPREYFKRIYFDSCVHDARALRYLLDVAQPEHVMLGTDYPFPLGEQEPGAGIAALGLADAEQQRLYHGTALEWLGLPRARFD